MEIAPGADGKKDARTIFRAVDGLRELLRDHDMLPGSLEAELQELRRQLTDILCPFSVEELDRHVKELDEKFPDWEHGYIRCGATVTWHDRPRSPEHPLCHFFPRTRSHLQLRRPSVVASILDGLSKRKAATPERTPSLGPATPQEVAITVT